MTVPCIHRGCYKRYSSLLWPLELQNKAFLGLQDKQAQKQACNYFMPVLYECSLWLLEILFPSAVRPWQILGGWETRMRGERRGTFLSSKPCLHLSKDLPFYRAAGQEPGLEWGWEPGWSGDHWRARLSRVQPSAFRCCFSCHVCSSSFLNRGQL